MDFHVIFLLLCRFRIYVLRNLDDMSEIFDNQRTASGIIIHGNPWERVQCKYNVKWYSLVPWGKINYMIPKWMLAIHSTFSLLTICDWMYTDIDYIFCTVLIIILWPIKVVQF